MSTTAPVPDGTPGPPVQTTGSAFIQKLTTATDWRSALLIPFLAVLSAFIIGGVIVMLTGVPFTQVVEAYVALFQGAFGSIKAISETLTFASPLILTGLSVAIAFRAGLFNIGGEGQVLIGGMTALVVGFSFEGLPWVIHLPLALIAGILGGAAYGFIPGFLRARTGAHEVIVTIMLNYIAVLLVQFLLTTTFFQREGRQDPVSKNVEATAELPHLLGWLSASYRVNLALIVSLVAAFVINWLLFRTTVGYEFRAVGANPAAARYAGISVSRVYILVMVIAGGLAGLAGTEQILGVLGRATPGFSGPGLGFDGIAVALLGRSNPWGVVAAAVLFGGLKAGGQQMQVSTSVGLDLIGVMQALIIMFVAAPALISTIYRLKAPVASTQITKGWAS
jgi:simple sugar transport system permease protein